MTPPPTEKPNFADDEARQLEAERQAVAAEAAVSWRSAAGGETTLTARFGVQDSTTAHALVAAVDAAAARNVCQTDSGNGADNADDAAPGAVFLAAPPPPKGRWEL